MRKLMPLMLCSTLLFAACSPDTSIDINAPQETGISFTVPQGWPQPVYNFENNALNQAGFELGRKLFYDTRFSRDNTISCGSCHQAGAAFAHSEHSISHGVDGLVGTRNSPTLFNLNWHKGFFWDGGVNHIESQPINPIQNPVEMDETVPNVIAKIKDDADYKRMFSAAWGDELMNSQRIFKSLAQFMGAMVSDNSKYDKYKRGEAALTDTELSGMSVYQNNCAACHTAPLFSDFSYRNNGLPPTSVNDSGRGHITFLAQDMYKFKVPSLRNLKYSAPYMHDGRFKTLEQVLAHYSTGIHRSPTLDPILLNGIQLSAQQQSDLLEFLNTLNDESFISDVRFHENAQ
ncbi:MAG: cytochrome-c peroxidase [Chitinophagales bacterium]|nr:cytochrome-c peroxidase [Chitinophagaceae bacterium]MCB9065514.1 cytochrome-c peroxidase [Chitinophagales bacterium]